MLSHFWNEFIHKLKASESTTHAKIPSKYVALLQTAVPYTCNQHSTSVCGVHMSEEG